MIEAAQVAEDATVALTHVACIALPWRCSKKALREMRSVQTCHTQFL